MEISQLSSLEFGQGYQVPCVRAQVEWFGPEQWVPIIGPLHEDKEYFDFNVLHYHIDFRFVEPQIFDKWASELIYHWQDKGYLLELLIEKHQILEGPILRECTCHRSMPVFPTRLASTGDWLKSVRALEEAFSETIINPKKPICPHRGFPLTGLPTDENGVVVCPGHGLAWDTNTGRCVRRFPCLE